MERRAGDKTNGLCERKKERKRERERERQRERAETLPVG